MASMASMPARLMILAGRRRYQRASDTKSIDIITTMCAHVGLAEPRARYPSADTVALRVRVFAQSPERAYRFGTSRPAHRKSISSRRIDREESALDRSRRSDIIGLGLTDRVEGVT
jgi:hypothetical protein